MQVTYVSHSRPSSSLSHHSIQPDPGNMQTLTPRNVKDWADYQKRSNISQEELVEAKDLSHLFLPHPLIPSDAQSGSERQYIQSSQERWPQWSSNAGEEASSTAESGYRSSKPVVVPILNTSGTLHKSNEPTFAFMPPESYTPQVTVSPAFQDNTDNNRLHSPLPLAHYLTSPIDPMYIPLPPSSANSFSSHSDELRSLSPAHSTTYSRHSSPYAQPSSQESQIWSSSLGLTLPHLPNLSDTASPHCFPIQSYTVPDTSNANLSPIDGYGVSHRHPYSPGLTSDGSHASDSADEEYRSGSSSTGSLEFSTMPDDLSFSPYNAQYYFTNMNMSEGSSYQPQQGGYSSWPDDHQSQSFTRSNPNSEDIGTTRSHFDDSVNMHDFLQVDAIDENGEQRAAPPVSASHQYDWVIPTEEDIRRVTLLRNRRSNEAVSQGPTIYQEHPCEGQVLDNEQKTIVARRVTRSAYQSMSAFQVFAGSSSIDNSRVDNAYKTPPTSSTAHHARNEAQTSFDHHPSNSSSNHNASAFPPLHLLPTKRSRGRRPVVSPDLNIDDHIESTVASTETQVTFTGLTKTGRPKKIFVCRVPGCLKCFRRSEHLKRHIRSIHTHDKPYACTFAGCKKAFARFDNLKQHQKNLHASWEPPAQPQAEADDSGEDIDADRNGGCSK